MVTHVDQISTPPTPADSPAVFEERAAQVWSDLARAVPQLNQQADEIEAIGQAADAAKLAAQADSDAAMGYRNEANAANSSAQSAAASAGAGKDGAEDAKRAAEEAADRALTAAADAENRVPMTGAAGAALLPEGADAQRPAAGSIPAGHLVVRGSTQDAADYKPEFFDRVAGVWKAFASRPWVKAITDAIAERVIALEARPRALGDGQTLQTVTRSQGVVYTNPTGRSIVLRASASGSSAALAVYVSLNGSTNIPVVSASSGTGPAGGCGSIVIPKDTEYVITLFQVSAVVFMELR